jgi:hypothetical protein
MKKNRQFSSESETANEMNIENDLIRNEKSRSIASHAYANLIVRTRVLSTKESVSTIQTKASQARFESRSFVIKKQHEKFKKTFRLVVKKTKDSVSKKTIEEISHKDINFVNFSIELRIVLKSCNNLINSRKRKRLNLLRQSLRRRNSNVIQKKRNEK